VTNRKEAMGMESEGTPPKENREWPRKDGIVRITEHMGREAREEISAISKRLLKRLREEEGEKDDIKPESPEGKAEEACPNERSD